GMEICDRAIVGGGAAGLAAAIFAGEDAAGGARRIVVLEGARRPGAKILVSGGGRCNVTNERVTPEDYGGGPRPVIRAVLRGFDSARTVAWMATLGVPLRLEADGKYFPITGGARAVLDALLRRVREVGAELRPATRVTRIHARAWPEAPAGGGSAEPLFELALSRVGSSEAAGEGRLRARRLILATGGLALPRSGSDGAGLAMARRLGHVIVPTTPALCPLVLAPGDRLCELAGLSLVARLGIYGPGGRRLIERTGSLLFTHSGLSGPVVLDLSRHWLRVRLERPGEEWTIAMGHPGLADAEAAEAWLLDEIVRHPRWSPARLIAGRYPERLARQVADRAAESGAAARSLAALGRGERRRLAQALVCLPLPVVGDGGYGQAEVTAGGVDLREVDPGTLESRRARGLFFCGEILDVDGRIGGFNFQWAWASAARAGRSACASLASVESGD
ncbi:MAG: aminoacetone oxidase family FAD-binding enzyme, partial [bacterium]|nr:aminoacetone oxidase family FAD-binding enzyme [bacterium]